MKQLLNKTNKIIVHLSGDHIDAFSAKAAFFIVLSFFPFLMFFLNVINYLPVHDSIMNILSGNIFPKAINRMLITVITEISAKASGTLLSVSAIVMLWSASVGMLSVSRGLNVIYHKNETRNYFVLRIISCLYTLMLAALLILLLVIMVFGNSIAEILVNRFPHISSFTGVILSVRTVVAVCVLLVFFLFVYVVAPSGKNKIKHQFPGALFSSVLWILFSYLFSYYIDNFSNYSYIYGSLTAILLLMLWLYFCMYIMFIGAEINMYLSSKR